MHRSVLAVPVAALVAAFATAGCAGLAVAPAPELAGLEVAPEGDGAGYEREAFGRRWRDVDRNGCGQRDDVLAREESAVRVRGRCTVVAGDLVDPYTGVPVAFRKVDADAVQVDHRVSLAEAWRSGAAAWTDGRRELFANDRDNLVATAGAVNREKGDRDAGTWAPAGAARGCAYARAVVAVKARYALAVDRAEARGLRRLLDGCASGADARPAR